MSIPGWQWQASPEPGEDHTRRVATSRGDQGDGGESQDLESWKAQVLARIWAEFNNPDPSSPGRSGSDADRIRHRYADHARVLRLLVEEIEQDTEVSAALRYDLAESLRSVARTNTERLPTDSPINQAEPAFEVGDRLLASYRGFSHARRAEPVARRLRATHRDLAQGLEEAEYLLRRMRMSHLKAAVAVSLTRQVRGSAGSRAIVRNLVDAADSLGEVADILGSALERSGSVVDASRTVANMFVHHGALERAAREVARSAAELRDHVRRLLQDRYAGNDQLPRSFYSYVGGLLDLSPRLRGPAFDPGIGCAFRSVGDQMARSMFSARESGDDRDAFARDEKVASR